MAVGGDVLLARYRPTQRLYNLSMANASSVSLQYIITGDGARTAVVLPIEEYNELIEDLADLAVLADRGDEPTLTHEEVLAELARDGLL